MGNLKVIIIGGGLAGSLLANGLLNNEVSVTLYERDAVESKREGYQIRLGEPSLIGFRACLTDEHIAAILEKFGRSTESGSTAPTLYNSHFKPVLDLTKLPSYSKSAAINRVVLRNLLIDPVNSSGHVRWEKAFSHYEILPDIGSGEKVKVHFADGTSDKCDILVGADGSGSKINRNVGLKNIIQINTHWSFLDKGSLPLDRMQKLPAQLQRGPVLVFAKGAVFFFALYLPSGKGTDTGSTAGALSYDQQEASFYWALNIPKSAAGFKDPSEIPDKRKFCLEFVQDWAPEFRDMLSVGADDDKRTSDIYATQLRASEKPSKAWRQRANTTNDSTSPEGHPRVWLIGDAIHAMQPNRGMGGNQAMRDCADALPILLQLRDIANSGAQPSKSQVEAAVSKCEGQIIDRAFTWVRKSGGASVAGYDLDGPLGTVVYIVGVLVLPVLRLVYSLFNSSSDKKNQ